MKFIKVSMTYSLTENAAVYLRRADLRGAAKSLPYTISPTTTSKPEKIVDVLENASSLAIDYVTGSVPANGFSLELTCMTSRCTSANTSIQPVKWQSIIPPVRIVTDEDGSDSTSVPLINELCDWTLRCPSTKPFMMFTARGTWAPGNLQLSFQNSGARKRTILNPTVSKLHTGEIMPTIAFLDTSSSKVYVTLQFNTTPAGKT